MTHDEATKKAREALESVLMEYPNNRPGMDYDGPLPVFAKKCLIALAALGSLAETSGVDCPVCFGCGWVVERDKKGDGIQQQCEYCLGIGKILNKPLAVEPSEDYYITTRETVRLIGQIYGDRRMNPWQVCDPEAEGTDLLLAANKSRDERIRRGCADRAVAWQMRLCTTDEWPCKTCSECHDLEAAIMGEAKE